MRYLKVFKNENGFGFDYFDDDNLIGSGELSDDDVKNSDGDINLVDDLYFSKDGFFYRLVDGYKKALVLKIHLLKKSS